MTEYKVVEVGKLTLASIEAKLNTLAQDDWVIVCAFGVEAIIMERVVDEPSLFEDEIMQRLCNYSLPVMDEVDVKCCD
jgi:hypothetical protein